MRTEPLPEVYLEVMEGRVPKEGAYAPRVGE